MKVCKFGGTSLADASQFAKVVNIILADTERKAIVVSAPGKRTPDDIKVTDLLGDWHTAIDHNLFESAKEIKQKILLRYKEIVDGLGLKFDIEHEVNDISAAISGKASLDYAKSRGEYLSARILAAALGFKFVDARDCICFDKKGQFHEGRSGRLIRSKCGGQHVVIPGFYGRKTDFTVKTFPRGGSDITGAIVASMLDASVYENWTDVSGMLMADPRIIDRPKGIVTLTYNELRELTYMGANVFHEEAMFHVMGDGITTNIRNTNDPDHPGTMITELSDPHERGTVTGIAGRPGFSVINIEKPMMNKEPGFSLKVLQVLASYEVNMENMPGGIDTLSVIVSDDAIEGKGEAILADIRNACECKAELSDGLAMIAVVGEGMVHSKGMAAKIFKAIADANISVRLINQGSSELNIIVGVDESHYKKAIQAIYAAVV